MSRNSTSRAFSLLETLIYAALLLVILAFIYASLLMALRAYRRTEDLADLQKQAMVASRTLIEESASSPASALRVEPAALLFLSARDPGGRITYASDGRALWQKWVCFYRDSQANTLLRKELKITPSADPPTPVPLIAALRDNPALAPARVATRVTAVNFTSVVTNTTTSVMVDVTTSEPDPSGAAPQDSTQISGRVTCRQ